MSNFCCKPTQLCNLSIEEFGHHVSSWTVIPLVTCWKLSWCKQFQRSEDMMMASLNQATVCWMCLLLGVFEQSKGATYTALWFSARPRQKTCNQTHLQMHHPQDTTNSQKMFKNITHNEDTCRAPLHKECPQHHGRKGTPEWQPGLVAPLVRGTKWS
jgi:hypothetical protein